jgi:hypothetical protein
MSFETKVWARSHLPNGRRDRHPAARSVPLTTGMMAIAVRASASMRGSSGLRPPIVLASPVELILALHGPRKTGHPCWVLSTDRDAKARGQGPEGLAPGSPRGRRVEPRRGASLPPGIDPKFSPGCLQWKMHDNIAMRKGSSCLGLTRSASIGVNREPNYEVEGGASTLCRIFFAFPGFVHGRLFAGSTTRDAQRSVRPCLPARRRGNGDRHG